MYSNNKCIMNDTRPSRGDNNSRDDVDFVDNFMGLRMCSSSSNDGFDGTNCQDEMEGGNKNDVIVIFEEISRERSQEQTSLDSEGLVDFSPSWDDDLEDDLSSPHSQKSGVSSSGGGGGHHHGHHFHRSSSSSAVAAASSAAATPYSTERNSPVCSRCRSYISSEEEQRPHSFPESHLALMAGRFGMKKDSKLRRSLSLGRSPKESKEFCCKCEPKTSEGFPVIKQGFLLKKTNGIRKRWKTKWVVLTAEFLYCYEDLAAFVQNKRGKKIDLRGCKVIPANHLTDREFCFGIIHTKRKNTLLRAMCEEEMASWIRTIETNCDCIRVIPSMPEFDVLCIVGDGGYSEVLQVRRRATGEIFAMKMIDKCRIIDTSSVHNIRRERECLEIIQHPFIVTMHFSFQTERSICFVLDFVNGGELYNHLRNYGPLPEANARFYACEVLTALEYLHGIGIVYRDLKPENILLDSEGHVCLTDFGLSVRGSKCTTIVGSPFYMAPEVALGTVPHGNTADWWSFGILIYEMVAGLPPFFDSANIAKAYELILTKEIPLPSSVFSVALIRLLDGLLRKCPGERLGKNGCNEIKDAEWFDGLDWFAVAAKQISPPFKPNVSDITDVSNLNPRPPSASPLVDSSARRNLDFSSKMNLEWEPYSRRGSRQDDLDSPSSTQSTPNVKSLLSRPSVESKGNTTPNYQPHGSPPFLRKASESDIFRRDSSGMGL